MLRGWLEDPNRAPYVSGYVLLPDLATGGRISFLVDTGADSTCVHPASLIWPIAGYPGLRNLPWSYASGIGGSVTVYRADGVILFHEKAKLYMYRVSIDLPDPDEADFIPPLLGRDILQHWHMKYDPRRGKVGFDVRHADTIRRI